MQEGEKKKHKAEQTTLFTKSRNLSIGPQVKQVEELGGMVKKKKRKG
jgi:hypothetical protein